MLVLKNMFAFYNKMFNENLGRPLKEQFVLHCDSQLFLFKTLERRNYF